MGTEFVMDDPIKPPVRNFAEWRSMQPPGIPELFGVEEIICEDVSSTRLVLVLQPINITEISSADIALKDEIFGDVIVRTDTSRKPKFYFPAEDIADDAVYCNLSGNLFQVISYNVVHSGRDALSLVPTGLMHMVFTLSIPHYMKMSVVGVQLRDILSAFPTEFRCPAEVRLTSNNLLKLMFIPLNDAYGDDSPFNLYVKLQWRLLNDYLRTLYGAENAQLEAGNYEGIYAYVRFGVGYKLFNDFAECADEMRLMLQHPSSLVRINTVLRCVTLMRYYGGMVRTVGCPGGAESRGGTELSVTSALYALSHSNVKCMKDLARLSQQKEVVTRLLCDADLRTAVVAGALKAIETMRASDTYRGCVDYDIFTAQFLPCLALRVTGLPESIYGLARVYFGCDPTPNVNITKGVITQLCAIPGFCEAATMLEGDGIDDCAILLNDVTRSVMACDPVAGYMIMAEALVQSRAHGSDIRTLCEALKREGYAPQCSDAMSSEDLLNHFRRSIAQLDKSGLQELVAAMVADQTNKLLMADGQCFGGLPTDSRIEAARDDAVMNVCAKASGNGPLSDFFPSLMHDTLRVHYVVPQLECGLRLPDSGPSPSTLVSDTATAECGTAMER
ncbi:hypothetical protein ACIS_00762 [Anaplasma centrale str. Israel]|uniref:Uncharacterized protein n=1 Tax=Anaplasma centrale (strain Israel) TaxID=574556 RepID=D1AS63_ANACI|nr:hypothetical protein [Anaplasma centrale]ACZ49316.1 hypothetical protein ACIS_00762 [Anaplasma centrale str. Israel]